MPETFDIVGLKAQLDEYGFVKIPNVISAADANLMAERVMEIMSRQPDSAISIATSPPCSNT